MKKKSKFNPLLLFPILFLVFSFFCLLTLRNIPRELETEKWPSVKGVLKDINVRTAPGKNTAIFFSGEYKYSVDGNEYTGKNVFGHKAGDSCMPEKIKEELGMYYDHFKKLPSVVKLKDPIEVDVYYNPKNHSDAVLYRKAMWAFINPGIFGGGLLLLGLILIPVVIKLKHITVKNQEDETSDGEQGLTG